MKNINCPNCKDDIISKEPFLLELKIKDKIYTTKVFMKSTIVLGDDIYADCGIGYMKLLYYSDID